MNASLTPLENYAESMRLRDMGLQSVESHSQEWADKAFQQMKAIRFNSLYQHDYPNGFTTQNIRSWIKTTVGNPDHANAWGAFIMRCVRAKILQDTGATARTGAHSRKQTIYVFNRGALA